MDAYLRLIQQTQVESYNEDMQALHDVLSGTLLDLYEVVRKIVILLCLINLFIKKNFFFNVILNPPQLSPTYCSNCISPEAGGTTLNNCFTVPQLSTRYFTDDCNLVSYISATISSEMQNIYYFSSSWLRSQDVGPLPDISNFEWLSLHVGKSSPALSRLPIWWKEIHFLLFFPLYFLFCFIISLVFLIYCSNMHTSTWTSTYLLHIITRTDFY